MKKRIYISGPMTGYPELNFPAFADAAKKLRELGYDVISPHEIQQPIQTWEACMKEDIKQLMDAEVIVKLEGWRQSAGARLEIELGTRLGMKAFELEEMLKKGEIVA